jgi:beta-lactamase class A
MEGRRKKILLIVWHVFFISLTVFLARSYVESKTDQVEKDVPKTQEVRESGYRLVSPLLECNVDGESALKKYVPFENKVKLQIQNDIINKNSDVHLSVYFRNLNDGPWFGINAGDDFAPASLLKVPLMIAYLKKSEQDPGVLTKTIIYDASQGDNVNQDIPPKDPLVSGESYTVEDLINRMIIYSDNQAMQLLVKNISVDDFNQTYIDLGVVVPDAQSPANFMSVKEYASFFRILYNAAYLDKSTSEKAMEILSKSDYEDGIIAGVDSGVTVAHKFGERNSDNNGVAEKQLHDCGVVYYAKYPYLLCVMTKGNDFQKLSGIIAQTSRIVFNEIKKDFPQ